MSFTGLNAGGMHPCDGENDAGYSTAIKARQFPGGGSRTRIVRDAGLVPGIPDAEITDAGIRDVEQRTAAWLRGRQAADGHWRAPLEGDTILESEYLLLLAWAGRLDSAAWQSLRESNLPRTVDHELPAVDTLPLKFPKLTPAGIEPPVDHDALLEREHV